MGLKYISGNTPGIRRVKKGSGFCYLDARGRPLRNQNTLRRIQSLAVPPAWTEVWICPDANGHLQATGRDARGRKQHRYHSDWRKARDETKYNQMIAFARALPRIRRRVKKDLARRGLSREKVLATVVRLLEVSAIRVGNDEYARDNQSFGLTTMRDRHARINGSTVQFQFRGKGGKEHLVDVRDKRLARIIRQCQDLPGQELLQYLDDDGVRRDVTSEDVNAYLREISGGEFTAKAFRTWTGTVLAAMALREFERVDSQAKAKRNVTRAIESVAKKLGNTPAICKKCYVHPAVLDSYLNGTMLKTLEQRAEEEIRTSLPRLPPEEAAVLVLLEKRLEEEISHGHLK